MTAAPAKTINEVTHERQVADLPEAERLMDAICKAMFAYRDFLADRGLIWNIDDENPCKVKRLIAEISYEGSEVCEISLIGGALDRAYGDEPVDDEGKPKPSH